MKVIGALFLLIPLAFGQSTSTQPQQTTPQTDNSAVKPEDKCGVEGKVLNAVTGEPLKKAHVTLRRMDSTTVNAPTYGAVTDAAGRFTITNVDPGRYHISAERNGFVRSENTPRKLKSIPDTLTLETAQKVGDLQIKLTPQGVITGRVIDEDNEPVSYVMIQCMRYRYMNGKKTLMNFGAATTNDKGEYRAFGLAAGKYYLSATNRQNMDGPAEIRAQATADEEYVQTYYPNALDPTNAIQVDVASGAEVSGIDIRLVRAKTLQISGTVMDRTKSSIPVQVMLTRQDSSPANFPAMKRVMTDAKGRFVIRGVMPGAYTLQAVEFSDQQQRAALMQVTVGDSNLDGVQLTFGSPPEITGIFKIENSPQQAKDQQQTQAQAQQTESDAAPSRHVFLNPESNLPMYMGNGGEVKEDGTFTLKNIMPQKYRISVYPLDGDAYLKQVVIGDKETVDGRVDFSSGIDATQIKVVVSINGAHIEGSVKDDKQQTTPRATVVLVPSPTDATPRYKSASTDQNGHFVLRGIAPGKYKLYAFDQIDSGAFYDVDYMKPFDGKGETVDVSEGDRLTRDLTLIVNDEDGAQR